MFGVGLEVLCKICPSAAHANHDALAVFAYTAHEQFERFLVSGYQMVDFDFWIICTSSQPLLVGWR
jgi:hypothetical protein